MSSVGVCTGVRLKPGETISARNLLKAALMNSANDAAIALGKHIGKTQDGFAKIMNTRAVQLGLKNTHFCTPSGLEPDGREHECYSSASDMATIAVHALSFPEIWKSCAMKNNSLLLLMESIRMKFSILTSFWDNFQISLEPKLASHHWLAIHFWQSPLIIQKTTRW